MDRAAHVEAPGREQLRQRVDALVFRPEVVDQEEVVELLLDPLRPGLARREQGRDEFIAREAEPLRAFRLERRPAQQVEGERTQRRVVERPRGRRLRAIVLRRSRGHDRSLRARGQREDRGQGEAREGGEHPWVQVTSS
jgi:hypothetical protein